VTEDGASEAPLVAHVVDVFLPLSETFVYGYLRHCQTTKPIVFGTSRINEAHFPFSPVRLYWRRPPLPARAVLRGLRTLDPQVDERLCRAILTARLAWTRPRLIHAHFGQMGMRAIAARRRLGIPLVVSFYGIDMSYFPTLPAYRAQLTTLFAHADVVLAIGERMKSKLATLGADPHRTRIVRVGADLNRFVFQPRFQQPGDPVRFFFCGRFVEKKGVPYLLRAFARVRAQHPDVELTLIGDGGLRPQVEQLIAELEMGSSVRVLGMQPHDRVAEEMSRAHILVGPSVTAKNGDDEGGILTCGLEGSASGLPLIATRHADIPEQLVNGENGLMVEERDVEGLANAMLTLARSPERWGAMGAAGRRLMSERFDVVTETRALEGVYRDLLGEKGLAGESYGAIRSAAPANDAAQSLSKSTRSIT